MSRLVAVILVASAVLIPPLDLFGQAPPPRLSAIGAVSEPGGSFSFGVRFSGSTSVTFSGIGTLTPSFGGTDATSIQTRLYHDGAVALDARSGTGSLPQLDDGFTNSWNFVFEEQLSADAQSVAFNTYSTVGEDLNLQTESGGLPGVDLELGWRIAGYGRRMPDTRMTGSWGVTLGFGVSELNANTREIINPTLITTRDVYSTDGNVVPVIEHLTPPYSSPSSRSVIVTNDDGTTRSVLIDTSILLSNRPVTRTLLSEPGGADVEGYWQVKGTSGTGRAGLWTRFYLTRSLSLRAGAGVSYSILGYKMRYDERLFMEGLMTTELREQSQSTTESKGVFGYYGNLDLEFWLSSKTGIFASFTHDASSSDLDMEIGGRRAVVDVSGGTGFRFGITTMF